MNDYAAERAAATAAHAGFGLLDRFAHEGVMTHEFSRTQSLNIVVTGDNGITTMTVFLV